MKKIAFVIITMGKSGYLENMLDSLKIYENVILVDNSPEAKCKGLIGKYNFKYCHELEPGVSSARNAGAKLVGNVDYIYFLDDDLSLGDDWHQELKRILSNDRDYDLIGGRVKADYFSELYIPEKYLYLVGEKNLGENARVICKDYVGGCNLLVKLETYYRLGGFNTNFGHVGTKIGLNEDVIFQEQIRKDHGTIYYDPALVFFHHWEGKDEDLLMRVKFQGKYDRQTDWSTNKLRFFLRVFKYTVCVKYLSIFLKKGRRYNTWYWDCMRYREYIKK